MPGTDGEVSRCPLCGQAFYYEHNWDNDVYNLMDYGVLYRFDEKSLQEKIKRIAQREEDRKKEVKAFWHKARKKFSIQFQALSEEEMRVMDYLKEKTIYGEYLEIIASDLSISKDLMIQIANTLEKAGVIRRNIYWPLGPGEHNFQQEFKGGDPYEFTKISINVI